jgi:plastocyanin
MKAKALLFIPALLLIALALGSCGGGDDTTVTETEPAATAPNPEDESSPAETEAQAAPTGKLERSVKVEIADFAYDPDPVQVETGGKVIWQNMDSKPHTATADDGSFDTGTLEEGKLKSETFKEAGTYTYFCEIHPSMHGTIEVIDKE